MLAYPGDIMVRKLEKADRNRVADISFNDIDFGSGIRQNDGMLSVR